MKKTLLLVSCAMGALAGWMLYEERKRLRTIARAQRRYELIDERAWQTETELSESSDSFPASDAQSSWGGRDNDPEP